jgi:hypothetical protein
MVSQAFAQTIPKSEVPQATKMNNQTKQAQEIGVPLVRVLEQIGERYGRYFTIEQAWKSGEAMNWLEDFMVARPVHQEDHKHKNDAKQKDFEKELQKIAIPRVTFEPDPLNSKVLHVVDERVRSIRSYPLDQQIHNFEFKGTTSDLIEELNSKSIPIISRRVFGIGGPPIAIDLTTNVSLHGFTGTVRQALTAALPLENYNRVIWIATSQLHVAEPRTEINYRGKKTKRESDNKKLP